MATRSALDPSIRYDDADQEAAQGRARNQDFMFRSYLQNRQEGLAQQDLGARERMFQAELADRAAGRSHEGGLARDLSGTFDQRSKSQMDIASLTDAGQTERTRMGMAPQQTLADLEARKYGDQSGVSNAKNSLIMRLIGDMEKGLGGAPGGAPMSGAPAGGGFQLDPKSMRGMQYGLLGLKDPQAETDSLVRQIMTERAGKVDDADLPAALAAIQGGDPSKMPAAGGINQKAMAGYAQAQQAVAPDIQDMYAFLRKNNWAIGDADQATIAQKFQAISMKLDSFRVPQQIKTNILNDLKAKMQQALGENGVMFEAAGSDALRQQYGL